MPTSGTPGSSRTPVFTAEEQEGMKDFFEAYETHRDEIYASLLEAVKKLPDLSAIVAKMSKQELETQNEQSHALMRKAVLQGEWEPYFARQQMQGSLYANLGVQFQEWF